MQKMWEYKRIGKSMVCLLAAGALTFSNMNIVMAADPQAVAEKTEDEKAPKGIFGNGTNGISIDIHGAVYKNYAKKSYGSYAYGPEGCAWFASARASELTGNDTPIFDGMNWYHTWYDNYGYTRGQKPHAKALACYTGHVAVVEQVDGDEITISEGGWGPAGKEHGYTIIQTMTQKELESERGGTGAFIGYVYLDGAQLGGEDNPSDPGDGNSENSDQNNNSGDHSGNENAGEGGNIADGWHNDGVAWQYFQNGRALTSQWVSDSGKWYYVGADTYMESLTWLQLGGKWYYLTTDGSMAAGWLELNDTWYYLYGDGSMATGWVQLGSEWYYLNADGSMAIGWLRLGDTWYYLKENGSMATGWIQLGSEWYYLNVDGSMATGWIQLGNDWYYLNANGAMAADTWVDGFYLESDGKWQVPGTWYLNENGWWYSYPAGGYPAACWEMIGNDWYHFDAQGYMETGWIWDGAAWYYLQENGAMLKNCWISNYYVGDNGAMYTDRWTPDGYYVGGDGLWISEK